MGKEKIILPSVYLGNIQYYSLLLAYEEAMTEVYEHFIKQTFRNRCQIYGANGPLNLIIPLKKWRNNTPICDVRISYDNPWQQLHWRSLESAYRSSPFFEYYEDDLRTFYEEQRYDYLIDFNEAIQETVAQLINIAASPVRSTSYIENEDHVKNFLSDFTPKNTKVHNFHPYVQVFDNKHGFIENLSIADLLFNLGMETKAYLEKCIALYSV